MSCLLQADCPCLVSEAVVIFHASQRLLDVLVDRLLDTVGDIEMPCRLETAVVVSLPLCHPVPHSVVLIEGVCEASEGGAAVG